MVKGRSHFPRKQRTREPVIADVTFGHLRTVLEGLGFEETRRQQGIALKHKQSDTIFLFRSHAH